MKSSNYIRRMMVVLFTSFALCLAACERIPTGSVGLRVGFDKQTLPGELQPGSFNQVIVGEVEQFSVKPIAVAINNQTPLTSDNTPLADFDMTVVYTVTPSAVSDLWTKQSRAYHATDDQHEHVLMFNYMKSVSANAIVKSVRNFEALKVSDNRALIETQIRDLIQQELKSEKLDGAINIQRLQVVSAVPNATILKTATDVVASQNQLKQKTIDVQTAQQEALRIAALNSNAKAIEYMNAQAQLEIAQAVHAGKVNTIVVPYDFKGMLNLAPIK